LLRLVHTTDRPTETHIKLCPHIVHGRRVDYVWTQLKVVKIKAFWCNEKEVYSVDVAQAMSIDLSMDAALCKTEIGEKV
jgi:hypothetical protein